MSAENTQAASPAITVMTYNVGNGRARPERLVPVLRLSQADVIALQEVSHEQAQAIEAGLAQEYPFMSLHPGGFAGKALISRYPIHNPELLDLGPERPDLRAFIEVNGRSLALLNAHPPPPRLARLGLRFDLPTWRQIQELAALALEHDPCILLGDFNLVDSRLEYAYLRSTGLGDAFGNAGKGRGHTLPKRLGPWKRFLWLNRMLRWIPMPPMLRVDYIWYTSSLSALDAWIGTDAGSDHLPVLAKVALPALDEQEKPNGR
jgi:endonuclease/exonuclease/phosphatase family metal-dependent hydrolase